MVAHSGHRNLQYETHFPLRNALSSTETHFPLYETHFPLRNALSSTEPSLGLRVRREHSGVSVFVGEKVNFLYRKVRFIVESAFRIVESAFRIAYWLTGLDITFTFDL